MNTPSSTFVITKGLIDNLLMSLIPAMNRNCFTKRRGVSTTQNRTASKILPKVSEVIDDEHILSINS